MKEENKKTEECCKEIMFKKNNCCGHGHRGNHRHGGHGDSGAIYGLGMVGALFYFLGNATSFGMVMLGIGKAIFWPAILMFKLLTYLGM